MSTTAMLTKKEKTKVSQVEAQKAIDCHNHAAKHHEEAAKLHREAAKQHEAGDHKKAFESTVKAIGQHCLASEYEKQDAMHHAQHN